MRKQGTGITERNGGMHNQKAYRRINAMLSGHDFKGPRLYHLVIMDDIEARSAARFQKVLKAICIALKVKGIRYRWRACIERDEEKGLHFHVFMLVEGKLVNPCEVITTAPNKGIKPILARHAMRVHISSPKDDMHRSKGGRRKNYAGLAGPKLDDCLEWISYLVKKRSKPDDIRTIYYSSRDSLTSKPQKAAE